jgi:hypothetical protein
MNHLQRLSAAVALSLTLTLPAFADGHIPTGPGIKSQSTPTSAAAQGEIECGVKPLDAPDGSSADSITETVWDLLEGVLALF